MGVELNKKNLTVAEKGMEGVEGGGDYFWSEGRFSGKSYYM